MSGFRTIAYSSSVRDENVEINMQWLLTCMRWQLVRGVHSSRSVPLGEPFLGEQPFLGEPLGEPYS